MIYQRQRQPKDNPKMEALREDVKDADSKDKDTKDKSDVSLMCKGNKNKIKMSDEVQTKEVQFNV